MVGNLLDNAGKWAGGKVTIAVATETALNAPGRALLLLTIDDDGPGLAPEQREAATRRGQRLDETKPGSGLGLSIVADLAAAYGGSLRARRQPGWRAAGGAAIAGVLTGAGRSCMKPVGRGWIFSRVCHVDGYRQIDHCR